MRIEHCFLVIYLNVIALHDWSILDCRLLDNVVNEIES